MLRINTAATPRRRVATPVVVAVVIVVTVEKKVADGECGKDDDDDKRGDVEGLLLLGGLVGGGHLGRFVSWPLFLFDSPHAKKEWEIGNRRKLGRSYYCSVMKASGSGRGISGEEGKTKRRRRRRRRSRENRPKAVMMQRGKRGLPIIVRCRLGLWL